MAVERRYSKRYPMDGDVYIRYRKQRAFPARAVNCSTQGMFLKTESLTLLTGALVELEIFREGRLWEVMGIVSHTQPDGIGVMFWQPQPELYESVIAGQPRVARNALLQQADTLENHP
ncbi:MAG: PilZ domain-containing protein [Candidatus Thiodiazotropha sp.]